MIVHSFLAATLLLVPSNAYSLMEQPAHTHEASSATLRGLRDKYRPLLVFASSGKDTKFIEQVQLLSQRASDLRERQVLVIPVVAGGGIAGWTHAIEPSLAAVLSTDDAIDARNRFHISPGSFTVVLIGKDGGEKFRSNTPVTIERLNTVIDAMPMRQQERHDGHTE